ncbi:MAG: cell division protein FtsA [Anaerolineae bacterium]|nr:cell division protein FtsA [Chloroflexota bacterium]
MERIIAGIDVGSTKICTLIGRVGENGLLNVIGMGVVPSRGVRRGVITDVDVATRSIEESVRKAQNMAHYTISEAYLGISGSHIASQNSRGAVSIGRGDRPVDRDDIERVMEDAEAIARPHNRRILHTIPREYIIDGQAGIKNPIGLMGYRLEVEAHIVTGSETCIQNLEHCVEANQIKVVESVFQPLASALAVLNEEEGRMGVVLIDMGGGTTDMATYLEGSVWETSVFDLGGNHISNDIALLLRTPFTAAEEAKVRYAHAVPREVDEAEMIELSVFGHEDMATLSRRELCQIVEARVEEMFSLISREIKRSGYDDLLPAGVVLTGGTADLLGIREVAARELQMPVRLGLPHRMHGVVEAISNPAYATAVGLLLWGMRAASEQPEPVMVRADRSFRSWLKNLIRKLMP